MSSLYEHQSSVSSSNLSGGYGHAVSFCPSIESPDNQNLKINQSYGFELTWGWVNDDRIFMLITIFLEGLVASIVSLCAFIIFIIKIN